MQFVRFLSINEKTCYGIFDNENILEIQGSIFSDYSKTGRVFKTADVKLLTPCDPKKIFCIGLNFLDHIMELGFEIPKKPANFLKPSSSVINPGENIIIPKSATRVDYEGELAVIIKDKIKDVTPGEAKKHILGITPFNDVTERILSSTPSLVTYSKAFDTFTSFGPIVDTDIDPDDAFIYTYLNGKRVQQGHTRDMIFKPSEIVSFVSTGITLYPGDIISTGTPAGVREVIDGDLVEIEIGGISVRLRNPVKNQL